MINRNFSLSCTVTISELPLFSGGAKSRFIVTDLLKPATIETFFARHRSPTMTINNSDLEIMKCLLSDPRMLVEDIAKETSLSSKTVTRRLEKMKENHVLRFIMLANLSSLRLIGYTEFAVLIMLIYLVIKI